MIYPVKVITKKGTKLLSSKYLTKRHWKNFYEGENRSQITINPEAKFKGKGDYIASTDFYTPYESIDRTPNWANLNPGERDFLNADQELKSQG